MSHTQGKLRTGDTVCNDTLFDEQGACVGLCFGADEGVRNARAARIVQCWNSHDALVGACHAALLVVTEGVTDHGRILSLTNQIRAAIAQSEGGAA